MKGEISPMAAATIENHFLVSLGNDVGISFDNREDPREVVIYRPDRIPEDFAALAFQALEEATPHVAARIEKLVVAYDTRLGRTMQSVDIRPRPGASSRHGVEAVTLAAG